MHQFEKCEKCFRSVIAETIRLCNRCMAEICPSCIGVQNNKGTYCVPCAEIRQTEMRIEKEIGGKP